LNEGVFVTGFSRLVTFTSNSVLRYDEDAKKRRRSI